MAIIVDPPPAGKAEEERDKFLGLVSSLLDTYRPEGVLVWLASRNRNLNGVAPREFIASGEWQPLFDEADRLSGGPCG